MRGITNEFVVWQMLGCHAYLAWLWEEEAAYPLGGVLVLLGALLIGGLSSLIRAKIRTDRSGRQKSKYEPARSQAEWGKKEPYQSQAETGKSEPYQSQTKTGKRESHQPQNEAGESEPGHSQAGKTKPRTADFTGKCILIAEDMEVGREILADMLSDTQVTIVSVENGRQALQTFAAHPERFDLIFMDLQMPEMDGYTAAREIRRLNNVRAETIPIIAMTDSIFSGGRASCLAMGVNGHISKPVQKGDLLRVMGELIPANSPAIINPSAEDNYCCTQIPTLT